MQENFDDVNACEFRLSIEEDMTRYTVSISKNATDLREYIVKMPKIPYNESHFWNMHLWYTGKGWDTMSAYHGDCEVVKYPLSDPIKYTALFLVNNSLADAVLSGC